MDIYPGFRGAQTHQAGPVVSGRASRARRVWTWLGKHPTDLGEGILISVYIIVAAFISFFVALALFAGPVKAQSFGEHFQSVPPWQPFNEGRNLGDMGHDHGKYHDTYRNWTNKAGIGCCNDNDCRPTEARIRDDGIWEAVIDGQWTAIPPDKEIEQPAPDGRPHVCASEYRVIYCFVKPPAS